MQPKPFLGVLLSTLMTTCAVIGLPAVPTQAFAQEAVAPSPELSAALATAGAANPESLLASVYENVRLTPFRREAVEREAARLYPELAGPVALAAGLAADHANAVRVAAPLVSMPAPFPDVPRALPPGADRTVDLANVSEFNRNFGVGLIGTQAALDRNLTGRGVTVAVIDTGMDRSTGGQLHSEFTGRLDTRSQSLLYWFDPRIAIAQQDVNAGFVRPSTATEDLNGHGTHVAGIIGAARNGQGMQGIAPDATILSLQALASLPDPVEDANTPGVDENGNFTINGTTYNQNTLADCGPASLADPNDCGTANAQRGKSTEGALRYVATQKDVRVINGSFGPTIAAGSRTWEITPEGLASEAGAVRSVLMSGQIFAVAAGNDGQSAPISAESPTGIGLFPFIRPDNAATTNSSGERIYSGAGSETIDFSDMTEASLAAAEAADGVRRGRIIVVVATDANKLIAGYSNRCGVAADWCIAAPGGAGDANTGQREIYSAYPSDTTPFNGYKDINGTSMATPHVAGAIAVLIQAFPTYTPAQITRILFETAEDLGAAGTDAIYGRGFLRLDRALESGPAGLDPTATGRFVVVAGTDNPAPPASEPAPKTTLRPDEPRVPRVVWTQPVDAEGALEKEGDGDLEILGNAEFDEGVYVDEGELQIDGNLTAPFVEVAFDGVLSGNGVINGDVTSEGILAPGDSPGLLTVNGNVTLGAGNQTQIEIDGPLVQVGAGGYDRIALTGANRTFTAGGSLAPILRGISGPADNTFVPSLGQGFVFVSVASGQVAGSFSSLIQPAAGLAPNTRLDVVYGSQTLTLAATPATYANLSLLGIAQSAGAQTIGGVIDAIRPAAGMRPSAELQPLFASLSFASGADLARGLDQATGRIYVDAGQEGVRSVGRFADQIGARQAELALAGNEASLGVRLWTIGGVAFSNADGSDVDSYGGTFGADVGLDGGLVGAAFRYENGDIDSGLDGHADLDTYQGALYGTAYLGFADLSGTAGFAVGNLDVGRAVDFGSAGAAGLSSSDDGVGGLVEARISRVFALGEATLLPSLTVGYRAFSFDGTTESGRFLTLSTPDETFEEGHVTGAVTVARTFGLAGGTQITPSATVGYRGDFLEVADTAGAGLLGRRVTIQGDEIGRNAFVGGVKLDVSNGDALSVSAAYDVDLRDNLDQHSLSATLRYRW